MSFTVKHFSLSSDFDTEKRCACIGYFDGLHLGHQQLINKTISHAKENNCLASLITFDPDPWITIGKASVVAHITPLQTRIELAKRFGLDEVLILDFDKDVCNLDPKEFERLLSRLNIHTLVVGFDFTYGCFGKGNVNTIVDNGLFNVDIVNSFEDRNGKVSSSRIDKAIMDGDIEIANRLLGYPFFIQGRVIHGQQMGRKLGFPTANIGISVDQLLPGIGVYACKVYVGGKTYYGMSNVGHNPTCNYVQHLSLEVNIFDFDQQIYDKQIQVQFYSKIRNEIKFNSKEELIDQLTHDAQAIKDYFS